MFNLFEKLPILGSLYDSPEEQRAQEQLERTADNYRRMKPEVAQSYANVMGNQLSALEPQNNFLGGMVGEEFMLDLDKLKQSPVTPGMMATSRRVPRKKSYRDLLEQPGEGPFASPMRILDAV